MAVLSIFLLAVAFATSMAAIVATVAPRWSLMVALLRHGPAAEWAPVAPPRRAGRNVSVSHRASAPVARGALAA